MECPECQMENPSRELFCIACGTQIGKQCPVCGAGNPRDEEVCSQCGNELGVWRPSLGHSVAPLVNRDAEMAAIETALSRATQGYGQVVGVLGMPGVGSSRLCRELMARCRSGGMPVYEVACPLYGKSVPFLPVRELLRSMFGFHPDDSTDTAADRVATALRVLSPEGKRWIPFAQAFLAVGDPENPPPDVEIEARREMLCELATRFVLARAEAESVVLLIDDAQWLDPDSDAILARIVEGMAQTRLLLLLTLRPGYHASWTGKAYYHQLALRPLAREAGEEILRSLLGEDPSVSDGIGVLLERTRGYPYFIEEAVRLLAMNHTLMGKAGAYRLAHPLEQHEVPATVESVVAARIESLGELARRVLYAASIIAGQVPTTVLRRVAEISERDLWRTLGELQESAFVHTDAWAPNTGCAFVHPLAQEVAYFSQPPQKRVSLHGVVATALEEEYASNLGEYASLIAYHWDAANDRFKGDLWRRRAARGVKQIRVQRPPRRMKKR